MLKELQANEWKWLLHISWKDSNGTVHIFSYNRENGQCVYAKASDYNYLTVQSF